MDPEEISDHPISRPWPLTSGPIPGGEDLPALLGLALSIAAEAAALARATREKALTEISTKSSATDVVTAADKAGERLIRERLAIARPGDPIVGEEGGEQDAVPGTVRWILDPIDGTVNYVYGVPYYAVAIAAERDGRLLVGVVHNIADGTVWHAAAGLGAYRNGEPVHCGSPTDLSWALIATGFGYDKEVRRWQGEILAAVIPEVRDIRRMGSAAIDLCLLAEGVLDGYYERGPHLWDYAAGGLIAAEAGAVVSGLYREAPEIGMTLAAAPGVYPAPRALLQSRIPDTESTEG
ncbi:inositol monophosphatase [Actinorhabdospora filicis]|uniref:Inositol-1-monophosphatase n=1 Tax=Actinorhabdospora filicis TaxID=1785913 RepID=A0A9W6SND5_9ACTN|nr:inositol monophosphatase family protein [Actinorhabdospora filicis]GLZ80080.1 inositol monophosphatase [Actinorhabdospora filicis]